jgi:hypothetical protein
VIEDDLAHRHESTTEVPNLQSLSHGRGRPKLGWW